MFVGREPRPRLLGQNSELSLTVGLEAARPGEELQFIGASARKQRADQLVLAAEQVEQDPRARPDGRSQRSQRHLAQAVAKHVRVGGLKQLGPTS
ncbi:hypothetical protein HQ32_04420 [Prauserella sp. Am3]|nr:hypothetical protein HQ32_04420 [Prauserella sp. Am3]